MSKTTLMFLVGSLVLIGGAFRLSAQEAARPADTPRTQPPVRYAAEEGVPGDRAAETRRDHAVLEAALNDLASPKNPENRIHVERKGPGREIVINREMISGDLSLLNIEYESRSVHGDDPRRIPPEIQKDLKRRSRRAARTLADFRPANPDILVRDLDRMFEKADDPVEAFLKSYPTSWGYVWAYPPGYSGDGKSAVVLFEGGPNGSHGLDWMVMLEREGTRWVVRWRHCHPRE